MTLILPPLQRSLKVPSGASRATLRGQPGRPTLERMNETVLDVKGLSCPLPVLRANRALRGLEPGQRLRVLATDRAAVADFQAFCRETGHALLACSEEAGTFSFLIRRRE
jgi:tRNA 2-thiouridine synthesizing protein A